MQENGRYEPISKTAQGYVGMPIKRREDVRFITGAATYVDDIKLPNMLHAAILRSPRKPQESVLWTRRKLCASRCD